MITLNNIRELILKQDSELENILKEYFLQSKDDNVSDDYNYKKDLENEFNLLLEKGQVQEAKKIIEDYKLRYGIDETTYSMEGIIFVTEGNLEKAYDKFYEGLEINNLNVDLLFNMAYVNLLLGNVNESRDYCNKCLLYSKDEELNNQVYDILDNLNKVNTKDIYTFVTIGVKNDDEILKFIKKENHKIINILENKDIKLENKYDEDGITIYEVNNVSDTLGFITRNNENCVILIGNLVPTKFIKNISNESKIIYYTNNNLYTDKSNYMNNNVDIFLEKEICNISNLIITNNISVYNFKKIIEKRDNVFFIKNNDDEIFNIVNIVKNYENISEEQIVNFINKELVLIEDEYEKSLFAIAKEQNNMDKCISLSKYIYDNYNTEESYKMYMSLLCKSKDYLNLLDTSIKSNFCEDVYKLEIIYLYNLQKYDLVEFITYLSMRLYNNIDLSGNNHIDYKMANYTFDINAFKSSYNRYILVLENNDYLVNSPIVNRNMSYLLYANENNDYKKFYSIYTELLKSFNNE